MTGALWGRERASVAALGRPLAQPPSVGIDGAVLDGTGGQRGRVPRHSSSTGSGSDGRPVGVGVRPSARHVGSRGGGPLWPPPTRTSRHPHTPCRRQRAGRRPIQLSWNLGGGVARRVDEHHLVVTLGARLARVELVMVDKPAQPSEVAAEPGVPPAHALDDHGHDDRAAATDLAKEAAGQIPRHRGSKAAALDGLAHTRRPQVSRGFGAKSLAVRGRVATGGPLERCL
ncbi:hypothetical protein I4F81_004562 [Pyropia yezoensis]|uniref:Uncharacterized protein n=1 Tax=Pyropia yezoensis TaxID=2788 RepID=A0ACC3BWB3_PYRYE|nr:hypothetical protein I4F81_004562 [Neopyropia yezoensis]